MIELKDHGGNFGGVPKVIPANKIKLLQFPTSHPYRTIISMYAASSTQMMIVGETDTHFITSGANWIYLVNKTTNITDYSKSFGTLKKVVHDKDTNRIYLLGYNGSFYGVFVFRDTNLTDIINFNYAQSDAADFLVVGNELWVSRADNPTVYRWNLTTGVLLAYIYTNNSSNLMLLIDNEVHFTVNGYHMEVLGTDGVSKRTYGPVLLSYDYLYYDKKERMFYSWQWGGSSIRKFDLAGNIIYTATTYSSRATYMIKEFKDELLLFSNGLLTIFKKTTGVSTLVLESPTFLFNLNAGFYSIAYGGFLFYHTEQNSFQSQKIWMLTDEIKLN